MTFLGSERRDVVRTASAVVLGTGLAVASVAGCSNEHEPVFVLPPRPQETTAASLDGGSADGGAGGLLRAGPVTIMAGTDDGYVAYLAYEVLDQSADATTVSFETVHYTGGEPTVLLSRFDTTDVVGGAGNAVLHWRNVHQVGAWYVGDLSVWTARTGSFEQIATSSVARVVVGKGDRIGFVRTEDGITGEAVVRTLTPDAPTTVVGDMNLVSPSCRPAMHVAPDDPDRFLVTFCSGTSPTASAARLVAVDGTSTALLADDADPTTAIVPGLLQTSGDGSVVAVTGLATNPDGAYQLRLIRPDTPGVQTTIEAQAPFAKVSRDGANVAYLTLAGTLKAVSTAPGASPTTLVPSGVIALGDVTPDFSHVVFSTAAGPGGTDLKAVATATPGAEPVDILSTPTGALLGTSQGRNAFYTEGAAPNALLKVRPLSGGQETLLAENTVLSGFMLAATTTMNSDRVIFMAGCEQSGPDVGCKLGFGDASSTPPKSKTLDIARSELLQQSHPRRNGFSVFIVQPGYVVYTRPGSGAGLYVLPVL